MASTLCTRMRLLVTVDNYNHTHEHLFEFGVQHAEIANFTIQRLRNPAVTRLAQARCIPFPKDWVQLAAGMGGAL